MRLAFFLAFLTCLAVASVEAAPRKPGSDAEVLERLPLRPKDPLTRELADLRQSLKANPDNLPVALRLASRYYELVGQEGDPRYLGYAQAALAPWWTVPDPPDEVRVLRAGLRQFSHDFEGALSDLNAVLAKSPNNGRARALRSTIYIVQARYDDARPDCAALQQSFSALIATACTAMVDGLTGRAAQAYSRLQKELDSAAGVSAGERLWVELRLAEISRRLGQTEAAERHFRRALALNIEDSFLLAAYADLLLDLQRPVEVVALLKDRYASDGLLLRLALAEQRLRAPEARQRAETLAARYRAARLRGDSVHEQEEARFMLETGQDPGEALRLAVDNWRVQREPRDARVLLQAAIAARRPVAAQPVLDWIERNQVEDVVLQSMARQLQEIPR